MDLVYVPCLSMEIRAKLADCGCLFEPMYRRVIDAVRLHRSH